MLFREDVGHQRGHRAYGRMIPLYAPQTLPLVLVLVAAVAVLALWLSVGSYARTERVSGWLVPTGPSARIFAAAPGRLMSLAVAEGQRVRRGDRLGVVELQSANAVASDPAQRALALLGAQEEHLAREGSLARSGADTEERRLAGQARELRVRLKSADAQIALQRERLASAQASFAIMREAADKKYISQIDFESQRRALIDERTRLQTLQASRADLRGALHDVEAKLHQAPLDLADRLARLEQERLALDQRRLDVEGARSLVLEAPIDGEVTALQARVGETLRPTTPAMYVLGKEGALEVELFAPSRAVGFARAGQQVQLMYDAFPYQTYGHFAGTVREVSQAALAPGELMAPFRFEEPVYRIRVALEGQAVEAFGQRRTLQPGMTLSANLVLEEQSFLAWLLEPVNAVRNRT